MKHLETILKEINANGWLISLRVEDDGHVELSICRPEWVTDNLYAAVPLPTYYYSSIENLLESKILIGERR